jgi:hypothetical protein
MPVHESSVNFGNLIRDLAEMYPFDVSEVVVVELIANSLDARATLISIDFDATHNRLVVEDNGDGMTTQQFADYHDFAAGLKLRGTGIGFAGLGAKVSFNFADRVVTETRSGSFKGGSDWYLKSKKKLVWEEIEPTRLQGRGTRVEVQFGPSARPTYRNAEHLVALLRRHYLPLLEPKFLELYEQMGHYSSDLRFAVNGKIVQPSAAVEEFSLDRVREFFPKRRGKLFGYGILGVAEAEYPVAPDVCGVLICTYGKIIKAELFSQFPATLGPRLFGMVEVPDLVKFLTTAKTDFIRRGKQKQFERLYDPIRQEFKQWLKEIGVEPTEVEGTDEARRLERELKKLVDEVPELADFFGFRSRKRVAAPDTDGEIPAAVHQGVELTFPVGEGNKGQTPGIVDVGDDPGEALVENEQGEQRAKPISRRAPRGPKIAFADTADRMDLAWVEGSNVIINSGHPAYVKMRNNAKGRRLHSLFAIATAVQRFLSEQGEAPDPMFVDRMMQAWGRK